MTCGRVPANGTIKTKNKTPFFNTLIPHYDFRMKRDPPKINKKDLYIKEGVPFHFEIIA